VLAVPTRLRLWQPKTSMDSLPRELLCEILARVGPLFHAKFVCHAWNSILSDPTIVGLPSTLTSAAYMALLVDYNAVDVIRWARANGCPWDSAASESAARRGNLGILQWLVAEGCPYGDMTRAWATVRGHNDVCQWLDDRRCPDRPDVQWTHAIAGGHNEIIDWLLASGHPWPEDACKQAATHGQLDALKRARGDGCPWGAGVCAVAARFGRAHVIEWAIANGCPYDHWTSRCAGIRGDLVLVKRLMTLGCCSPTSAAHGAAGGGHLDVLEWAIANGSSRTSTCLSAAIGGHLCVLRWARANDCPWDEGICDQGAAFGHYDLVKWAIANGCPLNAGVCLHVAGKDNLDMLKWARANGCPWDEWTCRRAARAGHLDVLMWARANGCPWDRAKCARDASKNDHRHVRAWIDAQPL
jgi:hypothetical protein